MPWVKQFDEDVVLDSAMRAFWSRGFEATSMNDLVEQMGINRGSIYATFGDKRALFLRALDRYDRQNREAWFHRLAAEHGPRGAIVGAFEQAIESAIAGNRDGCLLVNTALELAPHDETVRERVAEALGSAEAFFGNMLDAAGHPRPAELATILLSLFVGVRALSRSRPEERLLRSTLEHVEALLDQR